MRYATLLILSLTFCLILASCSKDEDNPSDSGNYFRATITGAETLELNVTHATCSNSSHYGGGRDISMGSGTLGGSDSFGLNFQFRSSGEFVTGTFPIQDIYFMPDSLFDHGSANLWIRDSSYAPYDHGYWGTSGTITFSTIEATIATGTFHFEARDDSSRTVTVDGSFRANYHMFSK